MEQETQRDVFLELLRRFDREGVLDQIMLIGSWCVSVYRTALSGAASLPAIRTLDADFLIPNRKPIKREVDVPSILQQMGFVPTFYRSSGWVVYDHPELRVEFLIPELGRGHDKAHDVKRLHVKAQGLRYVNLLAAHPRKLTYEGLSVCVPEPAAYALQKLIISARRTKAEKRQKDLESAIALLEYLESQPREQEKMREILRNLPKGWLKTLDRLARQHHLRFAEALELRS